MVDVRYIIIGNSAAGVSAAMGIRQVDSNSPITILSDEPTWGYSRIATTALIEGLVARESIFPWTEGFYETNGLDLRRGKAVIRILARDQEVELASGGRCRYDRLLIATGSSARPLDVEGADLRGSFTLRTLADAEAIMDRARLGSKALVIGGGPVGVKACIALAKRGLDVELVVSSRRVLSQVLDGPSADLAAADLTAHGIRVRFGTDVVRLGGRDGSVAWAELSDGSRAACNLVIAAKGVSPNVVLARQAGMDVDRGVLVDDGLRTSVPGVYAAGDVAQAYDLAWEERRVSAIWPTAVIQGQVAGANMAGAGCRYAGNLPMNSLPLFSLHCTALGRVEAAGEGWETLSRLDTDSQVYRKVVLRNGQVMGAILMAPQPVDMGIFQSLFHRGVKLAGLSASVLDRHFSYAQLMMETPGIQYC